MIDKHRHRHSSAPRGSVPNWVLTLLAIGAMLVVGLARSIG
jgi:hypothetical protein